MMGKRLACAILLVAAFAGNAVAQQAPPAPAANPETIQIGLSTDTIAINAGFEGANLTVFGAVDKADPLVQRQGRYDVVVVLEGPPKDVVVRKKSRFLGIWVNRVSEVFAGAPTSYSLASTRQMQDITDAKTFASLSLGTSGMVLRPKFGQQRPTLEPFSEALKAVKTRQGLFNERPGGVEFISTNLFRATLALPADVPVGIHRARAFLFRNGAFLKESSTSLEIIKSGFEQQIYRSAHEQSIFYGLFSVSLAMVIGWLGRIVFKRD
jgi:uncharacterized protein (TIGR02186 family)